MDEIWRRVAWAERHGRRVEVEQIIAHMQAEIRRPSILDLVAA